MKIPYFKASWRKYKLKENSLQLQKFQIEKSDSSKMLIFLTQKPHLWLICPQLPGIGFHHLEPSKPELGCRKVLLVVICFTFIVNVCSLSSHRICIFNHLIWVSDYVLLHLSVSWFSIPMSPAFWYSSFFLPLLDTCFRLRQLTVGSTWSPPWFL